MLPAPRVLVRVLVPLGVVACAPVAPVDAVAGVEVPLLVVHGDRDGYFGPEHPAALAGAGALVWLEEGFGHAETAIAPELVDRIADHVRSVLA